jgi:putative spermidine/putrescine transport system ATP-binding protein
MPHAAQRPGATIELARVSRRYGAVHAISELCLTVGAGEFLTLLGSSGCGKTTTLMMVAGFDTPSAGEIRVDGRTMTRVPPHLREQGFVFQQYALFPHMTVRQNLAFPLEVRGVRAAQRTARINRMLERFALNELAERLPSQLSGGQQQRTALARALIHDPPLLLMDEPLAALDRKLRLQLQSDIKALQREFNVTVLYVTHDQEEALAMSDRIAIMNRGRIEQVAPPEDLYEHPASEFVASFMGEMNLVDAAVSATNGDTLTVAIAHDWKVVVKAAAAPFEAGAHVRLALRPECIRVTRGVREAGLTWVDAIVAKRSYLGECDKYHLLVGGVTLIARRQASRDTPRLAEGERVSAGWADGDIAVFSP